MKSKGLPTNFGWKTRLGLVASALWLCIVFLLIDNPNRINQFFGLGFLPLIVIWGLAWIIAGWRQQKPAKDAPGEVSTEQKLKSKDRFQTWAAVLGVLGVGLATAMWQFHAASNESPTGTISAWFGEWLVYGLLAYVVFRFIPRQPAGFAAILAAFVIAVGVNYRVHAAISEDRQALLSLSRAAPLFNKMQTGTVLSDQEVRDANVGTLEPLLLAQAKFDREVDEISTNYQNSLAELSIDSMLIPAMLASSNMRYQTRAKLTLWEQKSITYRSQVASAVARAKLGIQAAIRQMPSSYSTGMNIGFEEATAQLTTFVARHVDLEREANQSVALILNLLDAHPNDFVVDQSLPPNLLFRDEGILKSYRQHFTKIQEIVKREEENRTWYLGLQTSRTERLEGLLKQSR